MIIGQKATSSEVFLLDDVPGTSGRLDVLVRCIRAAFLCSHGLRHDVVLYFVLLGGELAPRVLRIRGDEVKFLRPDERAGAVLLKKVLASRADDEAGHGFVDVKGGIALARGGLEVVLSDAQGAAIFVAREGAGDIRGVEAFADDALFVIGDHVGIPDDMLATLASAGARPIGLGPVSVHAEDAVVLITNELDRRRRTPSKDR